tara:strand:- start:1119 stop:1286 length:168 start_codon:yes stop_codon:yes gene_type:complete
MKPMNTYLAVHPAKSENFKNNDIRSITFEDWILYILRENVKSMPEKIQMQYATKR